MPVVSIRALPQPRAVDVQAVVARVAGALAEVVGGPPSGTWATWEELAPRSYAEADDTPAEQPRATHPPLVSIRAFEGRSPELVERMLVAVAETLAAELGLEPGNVFVTYDEVQSGRVYDGGRVVKRD